MKYLESLQKAKVNVGDNLKNMYELNRHLERIDVRDVERILVAKDVFDKNLKGDYALITAGGGMCGYWALIYARYLETLGFKCIIKSVGGEENLLLSHIWVEIECNHYVVALDRAGMIITEKGKPSNYEKMIKHKFLTDFGKTPIIRTHTEPRTELFLEFTKVSIIEVPTYFIDELNAYGDVLINKDIDEYTLVPLRDFFKGFQLMYTFLVDIKGAKNIKELIKEKKTRAKYKR